MLFPLQGVLFLTYITPFTFFNIKGLIFITKTTKNEKESFCIAKRTLLESKTNPFEEQNESFWKAKGVKC